MGDSSRPVCLCVWMDGQERVFRHGCLDALLMDGRACSFHVLHVLCSVLPFHVVPLATGEGAR